jgi:hypothetical protein
MKSLFSHSFVISCLMILLLSASSCKKSTVARPGCGACDTVTSTRNSLSYLTFILNENSWVRQDDGTLTCDLTSRIQLADASVSQVYTMSVMSEGKFLQIYPNYKVEFMGGSIYGSVSTFDHFETCGITFSSSQERHYGELSHIGAQILGSIEIRVALWK